MNTSATGGVLLPAPPPAPTPLEGQELNRFLQQWVVGITGLDGTMVRPRYQAEPANIPIAGDAWAAIGVTERKADTYPYVKHDPVGPAGLGADYLQRHEEFVMLCSFYDLGTNGLADLYASLLRDGTAIPQNLEILLAANMGFVKAGDMIAVPSFLATRWLYRMDIPITLRRQIDREYAILNVASATMDFETEDLNITIDVNK